MSKGASARTEKQKFDFLSEPLSVLLQFVFDFIVPLLGRLLIFGKAAHAGSHLRSTSLLFCRGSFPAQKRKSQLRQLC